MDKVAWHDGGVFVPSDLSDLSDLSDKKLVDLLTRSLVDFKNPHVIHYASTSAEWFDSDAHSAVGAHRRQACGLDARQRSEDRVAERRV